MCRVLDVQEESDVAEGGLSILDEPVHRRLSLVVMPRSTDNGDRPSPVLRRNSREELDQLYHRSDTGRVVARPLEESVHVGDNHDSLIAGARDLPPYACGCQPRLSDDLESEANVRWLPRRRRLDQLANGGPVRLAQGERGNLRPRRIERRPEVSGQLDHHEDCGRSPLSGPAEGAV